MTRGTVILERTFYTSTEICRKVGISYRQLDYLVRGGRISPAVQDADGSGTQRLWAPWQVGELTELVLTENLRRS